MEYLNDNKIFKYLKPFDNEILGIYSNKDLMEILSYINKYYLEYRDILDIDENISFGIEIEIDNFKGKPIDYWPFQLKLNEIVGNDRWNTKNDWTLKWGREITSDILFDNIKNWNDIKNVCGLASLYGEIDVTCASHIHIGSQILGENTLYWYRFFKIWSIYENVIYRFCYGEYLTHRNKICDYAMPVALFYDNRLSIIEDRLNSSVYEMISSIKRNDISNEELKNFGMSYWHMLADNDYDLFDDYNKINYGATVEIKCPNGTLDEIVWQNNINFIIKLMLYCKSDNFNEDILNQRRIEVYDIYSNIYEYSDIYLEQAIELCDMIFNNNLDKIYFLRQYIKSFEISKNSYVKSKKFTITK